MCDVSSASHSLADRPVTTHAVPQTVIRTTIAGSKAHNLDGHRPTVITTSSSAPHVSLINIVIINMITVCLNKIIRLKN